MKGLVIVLAALAALSGSGTLLASGGGLACPATAPARPLAAPEPAAGSPASEVGRPEGLARGLWRRRLAEAACR